MNTVFSETEYYDDQYVVQDLRVCVHVTCICILILYVFCMSAVCESVLVFSCCGPHLFPFQVRCASSS